MYCGRTNGEKYIEQLGVGFGIINTAIGVHYREWRNRPIVFTPQASTANQHVITKTIEENPNLYSVGHYGEPFRYEEHDDNTCQIMIIQAKMNTRSNFRGDHDLNRASNFTVLN